MRYAFLLAISFFLFFIKESQAEINLDSKIFVAPVGLSQNNIDTSNFDSIRNFEYQLEGLSNNIINGEDQKTRITSTYYFIQTLKEVLKIKNSFYYPFST